MGTGRHRIMFDVQGKAVKCLRCGKLGHIRRDCPTCAECRQPGHVKADCEWTIEQSETFANKLRFSLEKREEDKQAALSALHSQWDKEKGIVPLEPKPRVTVHNNVGSNVDNVAECNQPGHVKAECEWTKLSEPSQRPLRIS